MEINKILAVLTNWKNVDGSDIDTVEITDENIIEIQGEEYRVYTEDEASEQFAEYQTNLIDELGIEAFTPMARDYITTNCLDVEWFNDVMKKLNYSYIEDIKHENGRLEEEMSDTDCETEEDFLNYLCEQYEDGLQYYIDQFGIKETSEVAVKYNLLNYGKIIEYIEDIDGRGCLASYDTEEREECIDGETYYIYRTN